jgi:peptidoglycan/LPS O-acetylase OafA/YrhL
MLIFGKQRGLLVASTTLIAATIFCYLLPGYATHFLRFGAALAFGSLVALGWKTGMIARFVVMPRLLLGASVGGIVALWALPPDAQPLEVIAASLCGCGMIAAFLKNDRLRLVPLSAWIGRISYSIYLVHGLVIDYAYKVFDQHVSPFESNYIRALLLFAKIVIVASALSYFLVERPGIKLGRAWARRMFGGRSILTDAQIVPTKAAVD